MLCRSPQLVVRPQAGQGRHVHKEELGLRSRQRGGLAQRPAHVGIRVLPLVPETENTPSSSEKDLGAPTLVWVGISIVLGEGQNALGVFHFLWKDEQVVLLYVPKPTWVYIYIYSFSRHFYPKRLPREGNINIAGKAELVQG